jgi:spermidine synthase
VLLLDGQVQSSQHDEHLYHEALVQPAMLTHASSPKRVLICGGGELATAREVLKHPCVEYCKMVDLDKAVVDASIKYLPSYHCNIMDDPRLTLTIGDAIALVKLEVAGLKKLAKEGATEETLRKLRYDVVIMDICDPMEDGPGNVCYFESFYRDYLYEILNEDGIFVTQSGPGSFQTYKQYSTITHNTLSRIFDRVDYFTQEIPSFEGNWAFQIAYKNPPDFLKLKKPSVETKDDDVKESLVTVSVKDGSSARVGGKADLTKIRDEIDARILKRFGVKTVEDSPLKNYDGDVHIGLSTLPRWLRTSLKEETRVFTEETQYFIPTSH